MKPITTLSGSVLYSIQAGYAYSGSVILEHIGMPECHPLYQQLRAAIRREFGRWFVKELIQIDETGCIMGPPRYVAYMPEIKQVVVAGKGCCKWFPATSLTNAARKAVTIVNS